MAETVHNWLNPRRQRPFIEEGADSPIAAAAAAATTTTENLQLSAIEEGRGGRTDKARAVEDSPKMRKVA